MKKYRKEKRKKQQEHKQRQKRARDNRSFSERVRANNFVVHLRELCKSKHVAVECRCLKI